MTFKAIFGHWINWLAVGFFPFPAEKAEEEKDLEFLIEAEDLKSATEFAERFQGLETHAHEGIGKLKCVISATRFDSGLSHLSVYEDYLKAQTRI